MTMDATLKVVLSMAIVFSMAVAALVMSIVSLSIPRTMQTLSSPMILAEQRRVEIGKLGIQVSHDLFKMNDVLDVKSQRRVQGFAHIHYHPSAEGQFHAKRALLEWEEKSKAQLNSTNSSSNVLDSIIPQTKVQENSTNSTSLDDLNKTTPPSKDQENKSSKTGKANKGKAKPKTSNPQKVNNSTSQKNNPSATCYAFLAEGARWKVTESWAVDPTNSQGLSETFIVTTAMNAWNSQVTFKIFGSRLPNSIVDGPDTVTPDGKNEVVFGSISTPGVIAVTFTWGIFDGPIAHRELIEWDMVTSYLGCTLKMFYSGL